MMDPDRRAFRKRLDKRIEHSVMRLMNKYAKDDNIPHVYGYKEIFVHVLRDFNQSSGFKDENNLVYHRLTRYVMPHLCWLGQVQRLDANQPVMFKHLKKEYIFSHGPR